ncbi:TPA: hypothetical protein QCY03_003510 [Bacillus tropicus]|nr:hypothetical protein [Bacillus tropicus]
MQRGEAFNIHGQYRVQSKRSSNSSRLIGCWALLPSDDPDSTMVNAILQSDPQWHGNAIVKIQPALIHKREGEFANEPDILYKRNHFVPYKRSDTMKSDIVDVRKAAERWNGRRPFAYKLFGKDVMTKVEELIGDIERVAALEYYMHEAGHCLGYGTANKYHDGYFQINKKTIWPLVYVEEFRADLLSFGFAASHLPPKTATAIFLYNIMLRFCSHFEGIMQCKQHPYGSIPVLLYSILRRTGFFLPISKSQKSSDFNIASLNIKDVIQHMLALNDLARSKLVESNSLKATDAALNAAKFYRTMLNHEIVHEFEIIISAASIR